MAGGIGIVVGVDAGMLEEQLGAVGLLIQELAILTQPELVGNCKQYNQVLQ